MPYKYTVRKFDGDDRYSWAVFRSEDVSKIPRGRPVFWGEAIPVSAGHSLNSAISVKGKLCCDTEKPEPKKIGGFCYRCSECNCPMNEGEVHWVGKKPFCGLHHGEKIDAAGSRYKVGSVLAVKLDEGDPHIGQVIGEYESGTLGVIFHRADEPPQFGCLTYASESKSWWYVDEPLKERFFAQKKYEMVAVNGLLAKRRKRVLLPNIVRVARADKRQTKMFQSSSARWKGYFNV